MYKENELYYKNSVHVFSFFLFLNKVFHKTTVWIQRSFLDGFVTRFIDSSSHLSNKINKYTVDSLFSRLNDIISL